AFDSGAARGGTIVLAGDSLPWLLYARGLGVTVEPLAASPSSFSTPDGLILAVSGRYGLRADGAERLLIRPDGDVLAVRLAYKQGSLVVSGRRLGPPLPAGSPPETHRTMYEHVQMLGSLYRRARLLASARTAFSRHYALRLARRGSGSPERSAALRRIESARTEAELIEAVAAFDDAG